MHNRAANWAERQSRTHVVGAYHAERFTGSMIDLDELHFVVEEVELLGRIQRLVEPLTNVQVIQYIKVLRQRECFLQSRVKKEEPSCRP